ncbi:tyrosine-type recombinase/integrase [Actinopolymorpha sp. B17G11]|uniref:tyrosine-type recombinase/integrase n=1 Tax=Actinopolymorpha sp. B17G11 TaxID=3160861 RepID=UPI0032E485E4
MIDLGTDPATGKRRQVRRRYETVDLAVDDFARIRREVREGTYVAPTNATVRDLCDAWLRSRRGVRGSTLAGYRDSLKPLCEVYGELPFQRLTKRHIEELVDQLQAGSLKRADDRPRRPWKPRSVNLMLFVLRKVYEDAIRQGLALRNVAGLVDRLPETKSEMQTYTVAEVRKLLRAARRDRLEHAWHLALHGLRRGEIAGLRWSSVDLKAGTLVVEESRVSVDGQAVASSPKSKRSTRTLPLTPELIKVLKRAKRRQRAEQLAVGRAYRVSGYVAVNEIGEALHPDTLSDRWSTVVGAAKVRKIRLHDARHTCGTLMHLQGVPIAVIAAWLGHADSAFTMRTYVHSQDEALHNAAVVLGDVTGL